MNIAIRRNCACIQPAFSAYKTQLTGKPSSPFERAYWSKNDKFISPILRFSRDDEKNEEDACEEADEEEGEETRPEPRRPHHRHEEEVKEHNEEKEDPN